MHWAGHGFFPVPNAGWVRATSIFLLNGGMGLLATVTLFAALLRYTSMHYLVARVVVSVFAGLAMFVVNATFNFRRV